METYQETQDYKDFEAWKNAVHSASAASVSRAAKADPSRVYGGHEREDDAPGGWGRWLQAVRSAANGDHTAIMKEQAKRGASGMNETVPSAGGFGVEKQIAGEILDVVYGQGTVASLCRRIPISTGGGLKIPASDSSSRADGSRPMNGKWLEEAATITASTPKLKQLTFDLKTVGILVPVTMQLLEDSVALEA
jgi:HK97 family phage major capsid protein